MIGQGATQFGDGLRIQPPSGVLRRKRAGGQLDLGRLKAVALPVEAAQFFPNRLIVRLLFEGAFHVPDGFVELMLFFVDDAHRGVGDEIARFGAEDALEHVLGVLVSVLFQQGLAEDAIRVEVFGVCLQDVFTAPNDFFVRFVFQQLIQFFKERLKVNLGHHSSSLTVALTLR